MGFGSGDGGSRSWNAYDGIKAIPSTPETLMAEVHSAIAASEYSYASTLLQASFSSSSSSSSSSSTKKSSDAAARPPPLYDARLADESYKAGCAALVAGKLDEALHSVEISLSKCPPQKTTAVAKLQSLISLTSQQLNKTPG